MISRKKFRIIAGLDRFRLLEGPGVEQKATEFCNFIRSKSSEEVKDSVIKFVYSKRKE